MIEMFGPDDQYPMLWRCLRCERTWVTLVKVAKTRDKDIAPDQELCEACAGKPLAVILAMRAENLRKRT